MAVQARPVAFVARRDLVWILGTEMRRLIVLRSVLSRPARVSRFHLRASARLLGLALMLGLVALAGACIPKPPTTTAPPVYDDGTYSPTIVGAELLLGQSLTVPTDNAYGRSIARIVAGEVKSANAAVGAVPASGGTGDAGSVGDGAALVAGDPLGGPLVVFDRCANGDCALTSSLVFADPEVSTVAGVSTTYSGAATLTLAGDGGIVRPASSLELEGTVVVDAASGAATLSLQATQPWADAAGVGGVSLDDVVVSGSLDALGGSGDVVVDGTGTVTGANAWGLADGVAARVTATVGAGRPVVAVRGFDTVEGGALDRLVGTESTAPEVVRRWLRAPEFWVISSPDGGSSPVGPMSPGTQVRLVHQPGNTALTAVIDTWDFGLDGVSGSISLAPAAIAGGEFSANATVSFMVDPGGSSWSVAGPVRMNLSTRQRTVVGSLQADVYSNADSGCGPCAETAMSVDMPDVWVGPVRAKDLRTGVEGNYTDVPWYDVEAESGLTTGRFGPVSVTSGSLSGQNQDLDVEAAGAILGHATTASTTVDLGSTSASVDLDTAVGEQMAVAGTIDDVDLALLSWDHSFTGNFAFRGVDHEADVDAQLSATVYDLGLSLGDDIAVTDDITLRSPQLHGAGPTAVQTLSVTSEAEWRRAPDTVITQMEGSLDVGAADVRYELDTDAEFEWAGGQVALRDLHLGGNLDSGAAAEISGTFTFPGNVVAFAGSIDADPAGWRLDLHEPAGAAPFAIALTWDTAAGTLTGSGSLGQLTYGRIAVTDSGFTLSADASSVDVTPTGSAGRIRIDGGATLDAAVSGAVAWDEAAGTFHADVSGAGSLLGRDGLTLSGSVDAQITDGATDWIDLDVTTTGAVDVGTRSEVRMDGIAVSGRLEGTDSTLSTTADVAVLGAAPLAVAGDATVRYSPEYGIDAVDLSLPVVAAGRSGSLKLDFDGNLASPMLFCTSEIDIDELGYGDFTLQGVTLAVCYDPPATISVSGTVDHVLYRDQVDLAADASVSYDLLTQRLSLSLTATGQIGTAQVTGSSVAMVWDIPAATLTGTAGVGTVDYGRVRIDGGDLAFTGTAGGFDVGTGGSPHILVDGGATLDAEVAGSVAWDAGTGMLHAELTGTGTVMGRADLTLSGTVDAHVVDGSAEWIDFAVSAAGDFRVGGRNEIRLTSFVLTGRIEGVTASLDIAATVDVPGVIGVAMTGSLDATFAADFSSIEHLALDIAADVGGGINAGVNIEFNGNLDTFDLHGWLTVDAYTWGDISIDDLRVDIWWDGTEVAARTEVAHVRYQNTVDVGGFANLGWDPDAQLLHLDGALAGRVAMVELTRVDFEMDLRIAEHRLWINADGDGRAVFGEGRHVAWFDNFHVWGDLTLDADMHATADLNTNGTLGFVSEDLDTDIRMWIDGTLSATFDGTTLHSVLSVSVSGDEVSAANVTIEVDADLTQFPIRPTIRLTATDLALTYMNFELSGIDLEIEFRYQGGDPRLDITVTAGQAVVHGPDWTVFASTSLVRATITFPDADHALLTLEELSGQVTLAYPGLPDISLAASAGGTFSVTLSTRAVDFDLTATGGVSVGGDEMVRFSGVGIGGTYDDSGLRIDLDADTVEIGAAADPWVVIADPSGTLVSNPALSRWDFDLDVGTVTAGDVLFVGDVVLTGGVTGTLELGDVTSGSLHMDDASVSIGSTATLFDLDISGQWADDQLTVGGKLTTGGTTLTGALRWTRFADGTHGLVSNGDWPNVDDAGALRDGSFGFSLLVDASNTSVTGTATAYDVDVLGVTVDQLVLTFNGTNATAEIQIDAGPIRDMRFTATVDWSAQAAGVADGTFPISFGGAMSVFGYHVSGSATGQATMANSVLTVDISIAARLDLISSTSLHLEDLQLHFTLDGASVTGTFAAKLFFTPSVWATVQGSLTQPQPSRYQLEVTQSDANGRIGAIYGSMEFDESTGRLVSGGFAAQDLHFGPATLDGVILRLTPSAVLIDDADVTFAPTAWTPGVQIAVRDAGVVFGDAAMSLAGQVTFSVTGPSWLPVGCEAGISGAAILYESGRSVVMTDPSSGSCSWGDGADLSGFHVQLGSLRAWWQTDGTGATTAGALTLDLTLDLGDLIQDAAPIHVVVDANVDTQTGAWMLDLGAAASGSWDMTGSLELLNSGGIGAYDVTITPASPINLGSPLSPATFTVDGSIRIHGNGSNYWLEIASAHLYVHWGSLDLAVDFTNSSFSRSNLAKLDFEAGTAAISTGSTGSGWTLDNLTVGDLAIEPDRISTQITADFTAAVGDHGEAAFHAPLDIQALRNQATFSVGGPISGVFRWDNFDAGSVPFEITGTTTVDLDTGIIGISDAGISATPTIAVGGEWTSLYAGLAGFVDAGANDIDATVNVKTGSFTVTGSPGGGLGVLVRAGITGLASVSYDSAGYVTGDVTLTNDGLAVSSGEIDYGASYNASLPGSRSGVVQNAGPEVRNVTLRWPSGASSPTFCGEVNVLDLLGVEIWVPLGSPFPTASDCAGLGSISGTVEVDSDNDGQADPYPSDPFDQPTGAQVTAAGPTPLTQHINQSDGSFHLSGVSAGSYTLQVSAPPGWKVVGSDTRTVTVTGANQSVDVAPPFLLTPFDKAGGPPQFADAVDGVLDLGSVTENVSWRPPRVTHEFPISVVDPDGDPVALTVVAKNFPASFAAACGNGPVCFELSANGVVKVNPPIGFSGTLSFVLQADDGHWPPVQMLTRVTVEPLVCGAVSAPLLIDATTDEDTATGGTFTLGDPCNAYFPSARILVQPRSGMASAAIKFAGGQPTHDIQWAYKPQPEFAGNDVFVIESCTTENLTEWQIDVEGVPLSCASTVVRVTVNPVEEPPTIGIMTTPDAFGRSTCQPYQTADGKLRFRSPYNQEMTIKLCAIDPEGVYSMDGGTITFAQPDATSQRTPGLGIVREDVTGDDVDDHMVLHLTPPPGWDGKMASFNIRVCELITCDDVTAELYGSDVDWGALPPYYAISYHLISNDWDRYYNWTPQHSDDDVEECMELYTDFAYTHPMATVIRQVPPLWHLMVEAPPGSGNWVVDADQLVVEAVNPDVSDATVEVIPGRNGATVAAGPPSLANATTFSYRNPPLPNPPLPPPEGTPWGLDGYEFIPDSFDTVAVVHVRINGVDIYMSASAGTEYESCQVSAGWPPDTIWWSPTWAWALTGNPYLMVQGP